MSETPAKPQNAEPSGASLPLGEPIRFTFSNVQARAVLEAGRVQKISQKYIDNLNHKILDLTNQASFLRKEVTGVDAEIVLIKKEVNITEKEARTAYMDTLNLVIGELNTPEPPWDVTVVVEKAIPVGIDLLRKESHTGH